jgi:hypothetical protein
MFDSDSRVDYRSCRTTEGNLNQHNEIDKEEPWLHHSLASSLLSESYLY